MGVIHGSRSHDRQRIGSASSSGSGSELDSSLDNQRTGELGHDESISAGDSEDVAVESADIVLVENDPYDVVIGCHKRVHKVVDFRTTEGESSAQ